MSLFLVLPIFGVIQTGAYRGGWHLDIRIMDVQFIARIMNV